VRRAVVCSLVLVVVLGIGLAIVRHVTRDPNQGWDTTCGDLLDMSSAEQAAVLEKAGVDPEDAAGQAAFYAGACAPHPEDRDEPIGDINP
jgi:hypothetical protein